MVLSPRTKKSAQNERFAINDDKSFYHWYVNLLADAECVDDYQSAI